MRRFLPVVILLFLFSTRVLAQSQTVANGSATTPIVLQATGCNYHWSIDKNIGLSPSSGNGNIPSFTAVNTTVGSITARITATIVREPEISAYILNQFAGTLTTVGPVDHGIGGTPSILAGSNAYGISVSLDGNRIFVSNQRSKNVSVIKRVNANGAIYNSVIATLQVGDSPKGIVVSPDGATVYVVNSTDGNVWTIDAATSNVTGNFYVGGEDLTGIALSPDGSRKYITQAGTGAVAVVDASNHVLRNVGVGLNPTGVAVSPNGQQVYVANNGGNTVSVINTTTFGVTSVRVGNKPFGVVASHDGTKVYVTNQADNTVSVINTSNNSVSTINVGHNPIGISITGDDAIVMAANNDDDENNVSVIHTADNSVTYLSTYRGQGNFSFGNFIPGGFGCSVVPLTFDITVNSTPPSITARGPLAALNTSLGVASASTSFTFTSLSLPTAVLVSPPLGFEVSTDDINFNSSGVNIGTSGNISGKVYVRLAATAAEGTYSGDITLSSGGTSTTIATAPSTVDPATAVVIPGLASGTITACRGTASTTLQQFTVSAVHLNAVLTATAGDNSFELSLRPDIGFVHALDIARVTDLGPTIVYVRASATAPAGKITGLITLTSNGAGTRRVTVGAMVYPAPVADPVANQHLVNGASTTAIHFTGTGSNTFVWAANDPSYVNIGLAETGTGDIPSFRAVNNGTTQLKLTVTAYPVSTGLVYVSNLGLNPSTGGSTVAVINIADNTLIASIPVGSSPKTMIINSASSRIYVANTGTSDISIIDLGDNRVIATIPVGHDPANMVLNADETKLSVYNGGDATVSVIDLATNAVISTSEIDQSPPGQQPISPDGKRAYSLDPVNYPNKVVVKDVATNTIITTVDVGRHPNGLSLSQDGTQLYVPNLDDNTISVINTTFYDVTTISSPNINIPSTVINTGGTGCAGLPAVFTITVDPTPPTIVATGTVDPLFTTEGVASPSASFSLSGINLTQGIQIDPPTGFEVSVDGRTFSSSLLVGGAGNMSPIPVYVRLAATMRVGTYTGINITLSSPSAPQVLVPLNGTVAAAVPTVTGSIATGTITACVGTPSVNPNIQQFTVSGFLLTTDATATAPLGFELALSPGGPYANSVTITQTGGNIAGSVVYVRSSTAASSGAISGMVQLSGGSIIRNVAINAIIHPPPVVDQVGSPQSVNDGQTLAINFNGTGNSYSWANTNPAIGLAVSGTGNISFAAVNHGITDVTADVTVTPHSASLAYVASSAYVYVEDLANNTQVDRIPLGDGKVPYAVAASADGLHVYVVNQGAATISVINTGSNTVAATITLSNSSAPSGIAISPDGSRLYVSNRGNADVSVINTATNTEILPRIPTGNGPAGIVVSPDGRRVYVVNQIAGTVSIIDAVSNRVVSSFASPGTPEGIAITPDGGTVYVANYNAKKVTVFNTRTNAVSSIDVGVNPAGVAVTPDGSMVYVTNSGSNNISVISTATNLVIHTISPRISAPKGVSVSPDGQTVYVANYTSNNVTVIDTRTNAAIATINDIGSPVSFGNFITAGSGCEGAQMNFQIIVHPSLSNISVTGSPSALTTTYGTAPASTSFNVAAINMTAGIVVTPPAGFEVSKDNTAFSSTVTIGSAGAIVTTPVYIRLAAATAVGSYTGDIKLVSGTNNTTVPMPESTVTPAPLTITADNKTKVAGMANPALTAAYTGFVNQEGAAKLAALPTLFTTADVNSLVGQYPITVSGATSANYTITYVAGILTVNAAPAQLTVSNTFTPNGDGINDTWVIRDLETYPGCTVAVFNRNGQRVFFSNNYPVPWDARYNGKDLPAGTYYYIITLGSGFKALAGYIAIIR